MYIQRVEGCGLQNALRLGIGGRVGYGSNCAKTAYRQKLFPH